MITEFSSKPKPQNKRALILFSVLFFISAALFIISINISMYRGIVGFSGLLTLVTAILVYTKYVSVVFCYDVMFDSDDVPIFVVRQMIGKRQQTLLRVELADIVSVTKETRAQRRAHKTDKGCMKYVYTPTLMPEVSYRLKISSRTGQAEVIIEGTDELSSLITQYAVEAREMREKRFNEYGE